MFNIIMTDSNGNKLTTSNLAVLAQFWNQLDTLDDDISHWFYYDVEFIIIGHNGLEEQCISGSDMITACNFYMVDWHYGTGSLFHGIRNYSTLEFENESVISVYDWLESNNAIDDCHIELTIQNSQ